jgi:hypothetical protein
MSYRRRLARPGHSLAATAALLLLVSAASLTAQAPPSQETTLRRMVAAIQTNSYDEFVAQGDATFKAGMTKQMLEGVSQQIGVRLKQGYQAVFLTSLKQQGYVVYLWKLAFKDGKDDFLARMAVKDGKVGGFWLQ